MSVNVQITWYVAAQVCTCSSMLYVTGSGSLARHRWCGDNSSRYLNYIPKTRTTIDDVNTVTSTTVFHNKNYASNNFCFLNSTVALQVHECNPKFILENFRVYLDRHQFIQKSVIFLISRVYWRHTCVPPHISLIISCLIVWCWKSVIWSFIMENALYRALTSPTFILN